MGFQGVLFDGIRVTRQDIFSGDNEIMIDTLQLQAVPEPTSLVLLEQRVSRRSARYQNGVLALPSGPERPSHQFDALSPGCAVATGVIFRRWTISGFNSSSVRTVAASNRWSAMTRSGDRRTHDERWCVEGP